MHDALIIAHITLSSIFHTGEICFIYFFLLDHWIIKNQVLHLQCYVVSHE